MEAHHRVRAVLREHQRLAELLPGLQLVAEHLLRQLEVRSAKIPSVVAVEADHIRELCRYIRPRTARHLHRGKRARPFLRIELARQVIQRLEIFISPLAGRIRLVRDIPHHDAGVIPIPRDQIADDLLVMLLRLHTVLPVEGPDPLPVEVRAAAEIQIHADRGGLVNDHDSLLVAQPHHLLTVRIVAAAETVGALPLHERNILHIHRHIQAAPARESILVLSVPLEIERSAVDQELRPLDPHRPHAVRQLIHIVCKIDFDLIQIRREGLPEMDIFDAQGSLRAVGAGHLTALPVINLDSAGAGPDRLDAVPDLRILPFHRRNQRHIRDVILRRGIQTHRPRDAAVIEEVKIRVVLFLIRVVRRARHGQAVHHVRLPADRQCSVIDDVVHRDREQIVAIRQQVADLRLKGQEPAAMLADHLSVQIDPRVMRDRVAAEHHTLRVPHIRRHGDHSLIKDPAVMIPEGNPLLQIIVGCRHRHRGGILQRPPIPFFCKTLSVVQFKVPDTGQITDHSRCCQHRI